MLDAPHPRQENTTVLASISLEGMGPTLAVEGATTAAVFEAYVEEMLAPSLRPGRLVVMDNLTAHKGVSACESSSRSGAASYFICHPTLLT